MDEGKNKCFPRNKPDYDFENEMDSGYYHLLFQSKLESALNQHEQCQNLNSRLVDNILLY